MRFRHSWRAIVALGILPPLGSLFGSPAPPPAPSALAGVKLMNYSPSIHPWAAMWTHWDPSIIDHDLAQIAGLNANTVRFIIQPAAFGYPTPYSAMMDRLSQAIGMANTHGLRVQLTLFDIWHSYGDLSGSQRWASAVLAPFRDDKRIQSIEVQNEIDPSNWVAIYWARTMIPAVRSAGGNIPVTISPLSSTANLKKLKDGLGRVQPDFYSFHYYGPEGNALGILNEANHFAWPVPLFIGETGAPSGSEPPGTQATPAEEAAQAHYLTTIENATESLSLPPAAPWIFQDFSPGSLLSNSADTEYHYGLFRDDGTAKPVATWLQGYFKTRT